MSMSNPSLRNTTTGNNVHVHVHPLVLLSVLDHHTRRQEPNGRVIGTLLGRREGNHHVTITNCFAVPHAERGDEVAIGKDFNRQMLALNASAAVGGRGSQQEVVVGWYGTSMREEENESNSNSNANYATISDTSSLIHDFYAGECDDPIHLVVDTSMSAARAGVPIRAYRCVPLTVQGTSLANVFHEVRCSISSSLNASSTTGGSTSAEEPDYYTGCSVAERIVMDKMTKGVQEQAASGVDNAHNSNDGLILISGATTGDCNSGIDQTSIQSLEGSMQKLLDLLEQASDFVDGVIATPDASTMQVNEEIGRKLADTISEVPVVTEDGDASFDKMIYNNMQDLLMVSYLSDLTKTQLSIAEKLNASIAAA